MIRAVREVIVPALDERDGLAQAQASLLLAHLEVVRHQLDHLPRYHRLELRSAALLAHRMVDVAAGGPRRTVAADRLRILLDKASSVPLDDQPAQRAATEELNAMGDELVRALAVDGETAASDAVVVLAVDEGRASARRQLSWCDPAADLTELLGSREQEVTV